MLALSLPVRLVADILLRHQYAVSLVAKPPQAQLPPVPTSPLCAPHRHHLSRRPRPARALPHLSQTLRTELVPMTNRLSAARVSFRFANRARGSESRLCHNKPHRQGPVPPMSAPRCRCPATPHAMPVS